jgi:hypothetical protein
MLLPINNKLPLDIYTLRGVAQSELLQMGSIIRVFVAPFLGRIAWRRAYSELAATRLPKRIASSDSTAAKPLRRLQRTAPIASGLSTDPIRLPDIESLKKAQQLPTHFSASTPEIARCSTLLLERQGISLARRDQTHARSREVRHRPKGRPAPVVPGRVFAHQASSR